MTLTFIILTSDLSIYLMTADDPLYSGNSVIVDKPILLNSLCTLWMTIRVTCRIVCVSEKLIWQCVFYCMWLHVFLFCNIFVLKDMSKIEIAAKQKESNSRKRDNSNTIMYLQISNLKSILQICKIYQGMQIWPLMTLTSVSYVLLIKDHIWSWNNNDLKPLFTLTSDLTITSMTVVHPIYSGNNEIVDHF